MHCSNIPAIQMRVKLAACIGYACVALAIAVGPFSCQVRAQGFPARPITFVVPNLAGGSSDLLARAIGAHFNQIFGQPVIIDNRPGASEMIAAEYVARSAPDGYTIAIFSNALSINETLSPTRRYDTLRDLVPVAQVAELPFALIVRSSLPVTNVKEFVAYAKANAAKLSYGHVGVGAPHYLTMEWFKRVANIDLLPVPFRSSPPVYTALLGGDIQVTVGALGGAVQYIENGQVRALAAMSARRPISQPNLPTVFEAGYPEFDLVPWMGVFVASGTPLDIVGKLEAATLDAANSREIREQLQRVGLEPSASGTLEFSSRVQRDIGKWAKVIKEVGAEPK
jgi:tripartite-type tricarboxylate transporter receptor subunit TctC